MTTIGTCLQPRVWETSKNDEEKICFYLKYLNVLDNLKEKKVKLLRIGQKYVEIIFLRKTAEKASKQTYMEKYSKKK